MKQASIDNGGYSFKKNEKAAAIFLLKLLILLFLLKSFFYFYNDLLIGYSKDIHGNRLFTLLKWSFSDDILVLLLINTPFMISLAILSFLRKKRIAVILVASFFLGINFICVLLNLVDVFYFHFHRQRADADLLYVFQHTFQKTFIKNTGASIVGLIAMIALFYFIYRIHKKLLKHFYEGRHFIGSSIIMIICCIPFFINMHKKIIPTRPLLELNSKELQLVQNSFHTFLYSIYRKEEGIVRLYDYMPESTAESLINVEHSGFESQSNSKKKNIVLFIMESIPEDFFNTSSKYKVTMPFVDSLVSQSTYFNNAYSFGYSSNKGIVSMLAGIPTLTEIPLYHSNYATMNITPVGTRLAANGYTSSFFIGDNYDDYGFAQCCNWLGIKNYYSMESIPGNKKMESLTMGLDDKYVLNFMNEKINAMAQPFFAINYNTSTHYPNELPKDYKEKYPERNFSDQMKTMAYYNECLENFFNKAKQQSWYSNTVFIFCSDHWMYPDTKPIAADVVQSFHIPIFIYDPLKPRQKIVNDLVSQLDILNTILYIAGTKDNFISYGNNLLDSNLAQNRVVFSKENTNLYHAMDSSYVLGFSPVTGKAEFCYNYKTDMERSNNLVSSKNAIVDSLTLKAKAFLQTASYHYNKSGTFK